MIVGQLTAKDFLLLLENWRLLAEASKIRRLPVGSGCTGSGMDWRVIKLLSEALATLIDL